MKKVRRFGIGFISSVTIHVAIAIALAVFGLFAIPKENTDIVEVTMYQPTSGGTFVPTKSAQQEAPKKAVQKSEPVPEVKKDDIVDTEKTVKRETPKQEQQTTPSNNTSNSESKNTSPDAKADGSGGSGGVGNSTGSGNTPSAPPGPPAPPAPPPDQGVPVTPPRVVSRPQPPYPQSARSKNQTGTVYLSIVVNAGGGVDSVSVSGSSGCPALDNAARNGAYSWSFSPAKDRYGSPCRARVSSSIRFSM